MDENSKGRQHVLTPLFFSLVLVAGMALGFNLRDSLRNKRSMSASLQRTDRLEEIIDLIRDRYVDTVNATKLYSDALNGILKSLDPHTVYIPADELEEVNDDLEGSFSGVGVEFVSIRDTIAISNVIDNGPAARAGMEVGDEIIKVDDTVVAGIHITSAGIIHKLKGKKDSKVKVTFRRPGNTVFRQVQIVRGDIPVYSVDAGIMLDSITGFIKINRFSATTYDEFSEALKRLQQQGTKQLIIDLRNNPGGYLEAATMMADDLLDGEKLIVSTRGTHTQEMKYKAGEKGAFESGRLALLIDEGSASASEILTGAVQDWDRGVVIGRRSFGKGLVQKQYDLPDGAALRLTVAKYYTPSGRCIQRSFAKGKQAYMDDYEHRFVTGELTGNDTLTPGDTTKYYTGRHRLVYGSGGISPDVYVPYDTAKISRGMAVVMLSNELKTAIWDQFLLLREEYKNKPLAAFIKTFDAAPVKARYLNMLDAATRTKATQILSVSAADKYFRLQVMARVARYLYRDAGYYSASMPEDEVVHKALEVLHSDSYSTLIGRQ